MKVYGMVSVAADGLWPDGLGTWITVLEFTGRYGGVRLICGGASCIMLSGYRFLTLRSNAECVWYI